MELKDSIGGGGTAPGDFSPRTISRIAGASYLGIIVCGIFAEFVVRESLIVPEDALATAANLVASEQLFRFGIAADLLMLIFDVILAVALYRLLLTVQKSVAQLATVLRLVHTAIVGASLIALIIAIEIATRPDGINVNGNAGQVLLPLGAHGSGYTLGLLFFGVHCTLLGYLLLKSREVPVVVGILMIAASIGYLVDGSAQVLMIDYDAHADLFASVVLIPAVIGELTFALWLLFRGFGRKTAHLQ